MTGCVVDIAKVLVNFCVLLDSLSGENHILGHGQEQRRLSVILATAQVFSRPEMIASLIVCRKGYIKQLGVIVRTPLRERIECRNMIAATHDGKLR
jgi:hypothetical protein